MVDLAEQRLLLLQRFAQLQLRSEPLVDLAFELLVGPARVGELASEISRVRVTALLSLSEVARMSEPQADISTAGVIIADRAAIGSGKLGTPYCNAPAARVTYLGGRLP